MIIFLLINLCLAYCGLVEFTGTASPSQQTLPGQQTISVSPKESSLDINNVDYSVFTVDIKSECCVHIITYRVRDGRRVTSVAYDQELWKAQPGQALSSCTVYTSSGFVLVMLEVDAGGSHKQEYYSQDDGKWVTVDNEVFETRRKNLQNVKRLLEHRRTLLDISGGKPADNIEFYTDDWGGLVVSKFAVKSGSVTSVVDNGCSLWMAEPGEGCSEVWVHSLGISSICRIRYVDSDGVIWTKYFEKSTGTSGPLWRLTGGCAYKEKHKALLTSKEIKIDIMHVDPYVCCHRKYPEGRFFQIVGHPFNGYKVSAITFCGMLIWKSEKHHCTKFKMTNDGNSFAFEVYMGGDKVSSRFSNALLKNELIKSERNSTFAGICTPKTEPASLQLDIVGPICLKKFRVYGTKDGGMTTKTFIPQSGSSIKFVTQHALILWEAGEDSKARCIGATCTLVNKVPTFLKMDIEEDSKIEHKFMQMEKGKEYFTEITERDYTSRVEFCKQCTPCEHSED